MNYATLVRILSMLMLGLGLSAIIPALVALVRGEGAQVFAFFTLALVLSVLAASVLLLTPKPSLKSRPSDALAVVIIWWMTAPLVAAFPFVLGTANTSILGAIHEAMSCLTTTGHSVIEIGSQGWPDSLIVWRGVLHIIGGITSLVTAASVFAAMNLGGPGIHRSVLFTIPENSFFDTVPRVLRAVCYMLGVTFLVILGLLLFSGVPFGDAAGLSISALTTGLVDPMAPDAFRFGFIAQIVLGLALVIGALGLVVMLPVRDRNFRDLYSDPENLLYMVALIIIIGLALLWGNRLDNSVAWALSALSTSGLALDRAGVAGDLPLPILVLPALIGGAALSTAGGVKLGRIIILGRRAMQEFRQLGYRSSRVTFRFRGREQEESAVIGVWVYLIGYITAVFGVILGFALLGEQFDDAVLLAIGGLANAGGLVEQTTSAFQPGESALMIGAMLLGRLEILALLPALTLSFWRS